MSLRQLFGLCLMALTMAGCSNRMEVVTVRSAADLEDLFSEPVDSVEVHLAPGIYHLEPAAAVDSTCGNCTDQNTPVPMTVGLMISGKKVRIIGPRKDEAVIVTHAGYGVYFKDCEDAFIERVTITGGIRDSLTDATDGAIVAKGSRVEIRNCKITDNIGDASVLASTIVGIAGICGREGSKLKIEGNRILRNSWDGIVLYRDAEAEIIDNIIDGVDMAQGKEAGGGRGVGIGITWNGRAHIEGNLITRYWKGIGLFVDANAVVRFNVIEDVSAWGISLWDAGKGMPVARIDSNVVYRAGSCGVAIFRSQDSEDPGRLVGNAIAETGQDSKYDNPDYYCYQCALAVHQATKFFVIEGNHFFNNRRATKDLPDHDSPEKVFFTNVQPLCAGLSKYSATSQSSFVDDFYFEK